MVPVDWCTGGCQRITHKTPKPSTRWDPLSPALINHGWWLMDSWLFPKPTDNIWHLRLCSVSLFSRNQWSTHAIWGMKFHDPPVGSRLGPWQERLMWAHGMIHPSEPSSPGWTISDGSMGHHDWTKNVQWTGVMAPATNLTAPVA